MSSDVLTGGLGAVKVSKQADGSYKASCQGVADQTGQTESQAILRMNDARRSVIESAERKRPFAIRQ